MAGYSISLIKYDFKVLIMKLIKTILINLGFLHTKNKNQVIKSRVPVKKIKRLIRQNDCALSDSGEASWFYTAYERGDADPLTNFTLDYVCKEFPRDASILNTGCGTGIMLFYLMDQGFNNIEGFDYLEDCVLIANEIAQLGGYKTTIWQDDGFCPKLKKKYDLILALHWVFSAWMGNYGNDAVSLADARRPETRERLLVDFFSQYSPYLNPDGKLIIELTDAVADYRLPTDGKPLQIPLRDVYPIRHTMEQVSKCGKKCGLDIIEHNMCCSYGNQPRTNYIMRKSGQE